MKSWGREAGLTLRCENCAKCLAGRGHVENPEQNEQYKYDSLCTGIYSALSLILSTLTYIKTSDVNKK